MKAEESVFKKIGLDYKLLDSGCCGMAGSFGFESGKYDLSVKVGERVLLPAVKSAEPSTVLIADGFSCREQIAQLTNRQALHTAEVLSLAMKNSERNDDQPPERDIVQRRDSARKRSMLKAGVVAAAGLGALAFFLTRRN
jgi:hypothetical protein